MQQVEEYFTPEAKDTLRRLIAENGGMEVFCVASLDSSLRVATIRVVARGNEGSVPAVLEAASHGMVAIHNHPSGQLTPSDADVSMAGEFGANGVGSFIVDNEVENVHVLVEPFQHKDIREISADPLLSLFTPDGELARNLDGFEFRPQQVQMVRDVVAAFNGKKVALVEAGTGVGKSMSYLIPSVHWAVENRQRVVISTNTINLQEQLVLKDIPLLKRVLGLQFEAALMKGRSNYLCRRKAQDVARDESIRKSAESPWEVEAILEWSHTTSDGSLSDLSIAPSYETWDLFCCEGDACAHARCQHFGDCFFFNARRMAAKAQIIITNHHLLMADLSLRGQAGPAGRGVLPAFHKLVIDEAHHLEDVAAAYLGMTATPSAFIRNLGRLQNAHRPERGLLPALAMGLTNLRPSMDKESLDLVARLQVDVEGRFTEARATCRSRLEEVFAALVTAVLQREESALGPGAEMKFRISHEFETRPTWREDVRPMVEAAVEAVQQFGAICRDVMALFYRLLERNPGAEESLQGPLLDAEAATLRLRTLAGSLEDFLQDDEEKCRWFEIRKRRQGHALTFRDAPMDVAGRLKEMLFSAFEAVILTSATLAIGQSFAFTKNRTGIALLPEGHTVEDILDSPFDYPSRVLLAVPSDLPDPSSRTFAQALSALVLDAARATDGGTFVLFTAYGLLNQVFRDLEAPLRQAGLLPLKQGQANRTVLLEEFRRSGHAVLFATDSFWEGVDVKGHALRCVIIPKLPFQVPSEPLVEARVEKIRRDGGNPFLDYQVPHAVIKLKQGFGRLIRSREDWGAVLICDNRLLTKPYGRTFLQALPHCATCLAPGVKVLEELRRFQTRLTGASDPA